MAESVEPDSELLEEMAETPVAMQDTDLRSMKDALLIETSQILGVCSKRNPIYPHMPVVSMTPLTLTCHPPLPSHACDPVVSCYCVVLGVCSEHNPFPLHPSYCD